MATNNPNEFNANINYTEEKQSDLHRPTHIEFKIPWGKWNVEELTGYKPITTFWDDFSAGEMFGIEGVWDTFSRAFREWKDDYKYLTEMVMVLNHKMHLYYQSNRRSNMQYIASYSFSPTTMLSKTSKTKNCSITLKQPIDICF